MAHTHAAVIPEAIKALPCTGGVIFKRSGRVLDDAWLKNVWNSEAVACLARPSVPCMKNAMVAAYRW